MHNCDIVLFCLEYNPQNLYNRRYLSEIAEELLLLAKRQTIPLSVLMIDIDKFKNINDTYGHDVGDEVIKLLANSLIEHVRQSDIVVRLGGEEFVAILPDSDIDNAQIKAEDIRKIIENLEFKLENSTMIKFTVSIGVSNYEIDNDYSFDKVLKKSDEALYEAKESGRNKVVVK